MRTFRGTFREHYRFVARTRPSRRASRDCACCGRPVRRSWRTGLLHPRCFGCRYLAMVYGPNIRVEWAED